MASASFDKTARLWPVPEIITELHEMELRTWVALGARLNDRGAVEPIPWQEWQDLRHELHPLEENKRKAAR